MARMSLPANLAAEAREMACRGRQGFKFNEAFTFEPFKVTDVHRSWTTIQGWGDAWFNTARARQRYEFTVAEPGAPAWEGRCAVGAEFTNVEIRGFLGGDVEVEVFGEQSLLGLLKERGTERSWRLVLGQSTGQRSLRGVLANGNLRFRVQGHHRLTRIPLPVSEAAGYLLSLDGEAVAAVEVINKGAVWIHPSVKPELRGLLAAAAAALLLYQDLLAL